MRGASPIEITAQVDISENFRLHSTVNPSTGVVELVFTGGTEVMLSFSRRGFEQFKEQWSAVVTQADGRVAEVANHSM
jgi:hypothetical protein